MPLTSPFYAVHFLVTTLITLGAIVARHLHINKFKGKIHGGIYATRLAAHFNILIRLHDHPNIAIPYNLVYSVETRDVIPLPAPALFDSAARGGYRIMPADIIAY